MGVEGMVAKRVGWVDRLYFIALILKTTTLWRSFVTTWALFIILIEFNTPEVRVDTKVGTY